MSNLCLLRESPWESMTFDGTEGILSRLETGPAPTVRHIVASGGAAGLGQQMLAAGVGPRQIRLRGYFLSSGEDEAVRQEQLRALRRKLCRITDPTGTFLLSRDGCNLRCSADSVPEFDSEPPLNGPDACGFTLRATACDPCFFMTEEKFPAEPTRIGSVNVVNRGDLSVGMLLTVKAINTVPAFRIENRNTGEFFSLTKQLAWGETLTVDSRAGQKCVTVTSEEGVTTDAISRMNLQSSFMSLVPGENFLVWQTGGVPALASVQAGVNARFLCL